MAGDSLATLASALAVLAGVVGAILALGWVVRCFAHGRLAPAGRALAVTETLALDPRRRLHLVRCQDRSVLLLTGGGADLVVGWVEDPKPS